MVPFDVTWFKAPAGAQVAPQHHNYASYNWTRGIAYPDQVGEIITAARPWSNGATPAGLIGTNSCGASWTGELFRSLTPEASNNFDQPACCNAFSDCQPVFTTPPTIDFGDGTGFHTMVPFVGLLTWRATCPDPAYWFVAGRVSPSCHGRPNQWKTNIVDAALPHPVLGGATLAALDPTHHTGTWYVPLSSPTLAGQEVVIHS